MMLNPQSCVQCPPINPNRMAGQRRVPFILSDSIRSFFGISCVWLLCVTYTSTNKNYEKKHPFFLIGQKKIWSNDLAEVRSRQFHWSFLTQKWTTFPRASLAKRCSKRSIDPSWLFHAGFKHRKASNKKPVKKAISKKKKHFLNPSTNPNPKKNWSCKSCDLITYSILSNQNVAHI